MKIELETKYSLNDVVIFSDYDGVYVGTISGIKICQNEHTYSVTYRNSRQWQTRDFVKEKDLILTNINIQDYDKMAERG